LTFVYNSFSTSSNNVAQFQTAPRYLTWWQIHEAVDIFDWSYNQPIVLWHLDWWKFIVQSEFSLLMKSHFAYLFFSILLLIALTIGAEANAEIPKADHEVKYQVQQVDALRNIAFMLKIPISSIGPLLRTMNTLIKTNEEGV
jgi:hypothetical protein